MHYVRWKKHGDPRLGRTVFLNDPAASFADKTTRAPNGCLIWTGSISGNGYGYLAIGGRKTTPAHRYAWERANGPIPEGMYVDHMCHNRACAELSHLRLATPKQNSENRRGPQSVSTSGIRGVSYHTRSGKWVAQIKHHQVTYYGGAYDTKEEAAEVAAAMRARFFTHAQD